MQIKYLKDAPTAQTGDICEVPDDQAKALIILGFAKEYDENNSDNGNTGDLFKQLNDDQQPPETAKPKKTKTKKTDTENS